jgi:hypothetical protein
MNLEHPTRLLQLAAAAVAIPAAIAGGISFYESHISAEGVCESLRNKVIGVIDRNIPADVKYALMHRDAEQFERKCAHVDPDTHTVFRVTIAHLQIPAPQERKPVQPGGTDVLMLAAESTVTGPGTASVAHAQPAAVFGLSKSGERRGWVALSRLDTGHEGESNFAGYADDQAQAPPAGTRLSARRTIPVWQEPQIHGPRDPAKLQGRLGRGNCVEVLATRPGIYRHWAEVTPVACP